MFNANAHVSPVSTRFCFLPYAYVANLQFYMCGSSQIAKEVKVKSVEILQTIHGDMDTSAAASYLAEIMKGRYATDVFD